MSATTVPVVVRAVEDLAPGVRAFDLAPLNGTPLPRFSPGAHVVVHTPGDRPRKNAYSLACSPWAEGGYRIAVRLDPAGRGGSAAMHEHVRTGDVLRIEPPQNLFAPITTARRHVLVAGGIGITPFVSYLHALRRREVPFELHYAFRDPAQAALLDELAALAPNELHTHVGPDGRVLLDALTDVLRRQPLGTHLSVCGPGPMMDAVLDVARAAGWPEDRLHVERFQAASGPMRPFTVHLARAGRAIAVAEDDTMLEALEAAGVDVPYQCRSGVCGECRVPVTAGVPDHRDLFLAPDERATAVMPCVSRCAEGPLVLDL